MKLLIVSGLSGSGKSIALATLEDCGYYCIDNLPASMLETFVDTVMLKERRNFQKTAIGIDARNHGESLRHFTDKLQAIARKNINCQVLFMRACETTLLQRYSETRRRHPLTEMQLSLKEALAIEREMLEPLALSADLVIDTSRTHYHQLRDLIKEIVGERSIRHTAIQFQSFGFKHGAPLDADFVFDVRSLPNPHWLPELRELTGKDRPVMEFLQANPHVEEYFQDVATFLQRWIPRFEDEGRSYLTIAIGCTGGRHRSVYMVEALTEYYRNAGLYVIVRHRELA
ncbi:MAG: RNase adapter RapZ [Methylococcales bacterium]|nr:RNase adapter RapZ [Methylococcales bacterium]